MLLRPLILSLEFYCIKSFKGMCCIEKPQCYYMEVIVDSHLIVLQIFRHPCMKVGEHCHSDSLDGKKTCPVYLGLWYFALADFGIDYRTEPSFEDCIHSSEAGIMHYPVAGHFGCCIVQTVDLAYSCKSCYWEAVESNWLLDRELSAHLLQVYSY